MISESAVGLGPAFGSAAIDKVMRCHLAVLDAQVCRGLSEDVQDFGGHIASVVGTGAVVR